MKRRTFLKMTAMASATAAASRLAYGQSADPVADVDPSEGGPEGVLKDPKGFAFYGSGQWTIPEGCAAQKFMKCGLGCNQIDPNARLCMASAVTGFVSTYGVDEACAYTDLLDDPFRSNERWQGEIERLNKQRPELFDEVERAPKMREEALADRAENRAYEGAPPTVPHPTKQTCASCHGPMGREGLKTTHPWRQSCQQCHAPSSDLEQGMPPGFEYFE